MDVSFRLTELRRTAWRSCLWSFACAALLTCQVLAQTSSSQTGTATQDPESQRAKQQTGSTSSSSTTKSSSAQPSQTPQAAADQPTRRSTARDEADDTEPSPQETTTRSRQQVEERDRPDATEPTRDSRTPPPDLDESYRGRGQRPEDLDLDRGPSQQFDPERTFDAQQRQFREQEFQGRQPTGQQFRDQQFQGRQPTDQQFRDQQFQGRQPTDQQFRDQQFQGRQPTDQQFRDQQFQDQQSRTQFRDQQIDQRVQSGFQARQDQTNINLQSQADIQSHLGINWSTAGGALSVANVQPGTAAAMIGLQPGDRILAVNNIQISSPAEFQRIIATVQPGAQLPIVLVRNGQRETLFWSATTGGAFAGQQSFGLASQQNLGINWSAAGGQLAVASLAPNSLAAQIGLRPGDQIVAVNNVRVASPVEFQRVITSVQPGVQLPIVVFRNGVQQTLFWAPTGGAFAYGQQPAYQQPAYQQNVYVDQPVRTELYATPSGEAFLGVTLDPNYTSAAVVTQVAPGGPAERAGIRPGDMIVRINEQRINSAYALTAAVARMRPGSVVDIGVSRRQMTDLQVQLGSAPGQPAYAQPAYVQPPFEEARRDTFFYRGDTIDDGRRPVGPDLTPFRDFDNDGRREGLFRGRFDNR
jgi:S1-C subfamily serine protease